VLVLELDRHLDEPVLMRSLFVMSVAVMLIAAMLIVFMLLTYTHVHTSKL
jgi:hypothetical protein